MLRSYQTQWKHRPTFPILRFGDGESHELLIVGDPWTFERRPKNGEAYPSRRHLANVVLREHLHDAERYLACLVWEINDRTFRSLQVNPTAYWIRVTRHGLKMKNTTYEIEPLRYATPDEIAAARAHVMIDLELVAAEKQSL